MLSKFSEPVVLHHYTLFTVEQSTFTSHAQPVKQKVHQTLVVFVKRSEIILGNEKLDLLLCNSSTYLKYYIVLFLSVSLKEGKKHLLKQLILGKALCSVQSLSHVQLCAAPWTVAHQASLSIANSWSLLKLMSTELVMPSSHLILLFPSLSAPNPSQHQGLFQ